ncbi:MAG: monovalent cation/H(+) antiporter subunit G [Candidatus Binatia bacterium]
MIEVISSVALLIGTFFVAVSSLGLLRLPDVYARLHAVTKASTLGVAGLLIASSLVFASRPGAPMSELLTVLFVFLTAPVGGHMIGRSAYLIGIRMTDKSIIDEMKRAGEHADVAHDTD